MRREKKKGFTLLEILICLGIISLVGVLVSVKGSQLLSYHRFKADAQRFLLDIHRYQMLSMIRGSDITCTISRKGNLYHVVWQCDASLPIPAKEMSYAWQAAVQILWNGKEVKEVEFTIFSPGRITPTGIITMISKQEKKVFFDLVYPRYLHTVKPKPYTFIDPPYPSKKSESQEDSI